MVLRSDVPTKLQVNKLIHITIHICKMELGFFSGRSVYLPEYNCYEYII